MASSMRSSRASDAYMTKAVSPTPAAESVFLFAIPVRVSSPGALPRTVFAASMTESRTKLAASAYQAPCLDSYSTNKTKHPNINQ